MKNIKEDATKKSQLRAAMNAIKGLLKGKDLPAKTQEHLEALDGELKKSWEDMTSGGPDDNPENEPQSNTENKEAFSESMTIGASLESDIHMSMVCRVDNMYSAGSLTRVERDQLLDTIKDVTDAFYTAILAAAPQLYDRSPWMDAPDPDDMDMGEAAKPAKGTVSTETPELNLIESDYLSLIEQSTTPDGTAMIKIIAPGWGSSGYYPAEVLERDGPKVFKAGTQMFWNHQTAEEEATRPEGDLNNLAGALLEDARWDANHSKGAGLYAKTKIYDAYQGPVNDLGPDIGVSIRALGKATVGKAEGRQGAIIQEIAAAKSVDFVTKPGAGGVVLSLFESARQNRAAHIPTQSQGDISMGEKELQEANAQLKSQLEQLQERMILREAGEYATGKLDGAALPSVTKTRLARSLVEKAPIKEGKLDQAAFDTAITEAIAAETAYLVEVTGGGRITGMGGQTSDAEPKIEDIQAGMKESYLALGYSEALASKMAKGR